MHLGVFGPYGWGRSVGVTASGWGLGPCCQRLAEYFGQSVKQYGRRAFKLNLELYLKFGESENTKTNFKIYDPFSVPCSNFAADFSGRHNIYLLPRFSYSAEFSACWQNWIRARIQHALSHFISLSPFCHTSPPTPTPLLPPPFQHYNPD
jgi:hypothetical protein